MGFTNGDINICSVLPLPLQVEVRLSLLRNVTRERHCESISNLSL